MAVKQAGIENVRLHFLHINASLKENNTRDVT